MRFLVLIALIGAISSLDVITGEAASAGVINPVAQVSVATSQEEYAKGEDIMVIVTNDPVDQVARRWFREKRRQKIVEIRTEDIFLRDCHVLHGIGKGHVFSQTDRVGPDPFFCGEQATRISWEVK